MGNHALYMRDWVRKNPEKKRAIDAKSYAKHRDSRREKQKVYSETHREEQAQRTRRHYLKNRQKMIERALAWNKKNKIRRNDKLRERTRQRLANDLEFRITKALRSRIWWALKGNKKSDKTENLIGCSLPSLRTWLEAKMKPGMSWENYGDWHIDHKKPCASFDLSLPENQKACFHYTNLQPLWAKENLVKGAKY